MKKIEIMRLLFIMALCTLILGLQACSTDADEVEIPQDAKLTQSEFQAVMSTDEWTSAVDATLAEIYQAGNWLYGKTAFDGCYEAAYTDTGFTVTFKNCVLNTTDQVNGTLVVVYNLDAEAASFTATYDGFFIGEIELNGTRTFTLSTGSTGSSFAFTVASEMSVALGDGTLIAGSGNKTVELTLGTSLAESSFTIEGTWSLTSGDNAYFIDVTSPLTGNFSCAYLVSGTMDLTKNGLEIEVDLGDGSCDNKVIITYPSGAKEELEL